MKTCPICGSKTFAKVHVDGMIAYQECARCGFKRIGKPGKMC